MDLIVSCFSTLINLTIALEVSQGVARHFVDATTDHERKTYASTSLWFSGVVYSAFVVGTFAFAAPLSELVIGQSEPELMRVGAVLIWCTGMFYLVQNQLRWKLDPRGYATASILATLTGIVISIGLVVVARWGVSGVLIGQATGMFLGFLVGIGLLRDVYGLIFDSRTSRICSGSLFPWCRRALRSS